MNASVGLQMIGLSNACVIAFSRIASTETGEDLRNISF